MDQPIKSKPKGSLYRKIFFMMLIIGVLPVLLAGLFALYSVTNSHKENIASIEENLINQELEEIEGFIKLVSNALHIQVSFSNIDVDFNKRQQEILLEGLLSAYPSIGEAYFVNKDTGFETARVSREHDRFSKKPELRDATNITGFIAVKTGIYEEGQDLSRSIDVKKEKTPYLHISNVNTTLKGPVITMFSNIRNAAGENISIIGAEVNLGGLKDIVAKSRLGNSGYVYVVDEDQRIIAASEELESKKVDLSYSPDLPPSDFIGYPNNEEYVGLLGSSVVASGRYMESPRLGIIAEWPEEDANRVLVSLRLQIISFSTVVLVLVIVLSIFLSNRIVRPIKLLEVGTERVAEGKFDEPVNIDTDDEIEELGVAFNKMTEGLKQLQALKDEFVFIAAHELKTPVAAIKGYLSIINEGLAGPVNAKVKEFINKVLNANGRLIRLVEDLLEVARAEAGRIKVDVAPIDISPVVEETLSELKPLADEKGISMVYKHEGNIPKVLADAGRVREVLVNLIGNSIKYTFDKGDIEIAHEVKGEELVTHVKDHGMGMSKEAQEKLFTKFYRVQTKETASITGTGLGLFIVKQIIEKMNGKIAVDSKPGKGSTFSFSLPLAVL